MAEPHGHGICWVEFMKEGREKPAGGGNFGPRNPAIMAGLLGWMWLAWAGTTPGMVVSEDTSQRLVPLEHASRLRAKLTVGANVVDSEATAVEWPIGSMGVLS